MPSYIFLGKWASQGRGQCCNCWSQEGRSESRYTKNWKGLEVSGESHIAFDSKLWESRKMQGQVFSVETWPWDTGTGKGNRTTEPQQWPRLPEGTLAPKASHTFRVLVSVWTIPHQLVITGNQQRGQNQCGPHDADGLQCHTVSS